MLQHTPLNEGVARVEHYDNGYRNATWDDVQALAAAGDVRLLRQTNKTVMHFAMHDTVELLN